MPIPFTCPHCGHQTNVADEYAGQSGNCAGCRKAITMPGIEASTDPIGLPTKSAGAGVALIVVVLLGCLFLVGGLFLLGSVSVGLGGSRSAARRSQCSNQLKQIGLALHNYHDTFKCFPPAYVPDEQGNPKHSWRVLILPFLEQAPLYDQYDFDEPWNGPNNALLASPAPSVFHCPADVSLPAQETNYVMVVGEGTISDGPTAISFRDMVDGTSNTIAVVEVTGMGIRWLEPEDLTLEDITCVVNDPIGDSLRSHHQGGAQVLFSDGSIHFFPDSTDPGVIRAMLSIGGGEGVSRP